MEKTVSGSTQLDPQYIKHFVLYITLAYLDIFVSPKQSNRFLKEFQIILVLSKCITQRIVKEVSIYKERWRYIQNPVQAQWQSHLLRTTLLQTHLEMHPVIRGANANLIMSTSKQKIHYLLETGPIIAAKYHMMLIHN